MNDTHETSANAQAVASGVKWAAFGIVALVVIFGDVMFIKLMYPRFPDGILRVGAIGGAIATALSIMALLVGKQEWFRPGGQLVWAYVFTFVEVLVSVLNTLVASGVVIPNWIDLAPATPFVALIGWVLILQLDRATQQKHENMEIEDKTNDMDRAFKLATHRATMKLRQRALAMHTESILAAIESPQSQEAIRTGAARLTAEVVSNLTGVHFASHQMLNAPMPAPAQIVDSKPPVTIPQATQPSPPAQEQPAPFMPALQPQEPQEQGNQEQGQAQEQEQYTEPGGLMKVLAALFGSPQE